MIRVIAGKLKGRRIPLLAGKVRATSGKTREAVFDILQSRIQLNNIKFLDWFAGSGAVGIEAISRGAGYVEFVEADWKVCSQLKKIIEDFNLQENCRITKSSVPFESGFDAAFADPPYNLNVSFDNVYQYIKTGGFFIAETSKKELAFDGNFRLIKSYRYGRTYLHLYEK